MVERTLEQGIAADPSISSWVFASAGSGKTSVLRDRVLRLLLSGEHPEDILCLTFTKAAAAEMANRISAELAKWAALPKEILWKEHLTPLLNRRPDNSELRRAQHLFAEILDVPGRLPIMTIHAFCQSLLRRFPIEAGLMPHFDPMEERDATFLRYEAWLEMIADLYQGGDSDLKEAFDLLVELGEGSAHEALNELIKKKEQFLALRSAHPTHLSLIRAYSVALGADPDAKVADIICEACKDQSIALAELREAAHALAMGGKTAQERAEKLQSFYGLTEDKRVEAWDYYCSGFIKRSDGEIYKDLSDKASQKKHPRLEEILRAEGKRILQVNERIKIIKMRDRSAAFAFIAIKLQERYEEKKRREAKLDYDDMINYTRNLLQRPGIAPWVLYKLDGKLRHILIDEAQDTNDPQWDIVKILSDEFHAGEAQDHKQNRTIFAVGDLKQSIYGFQGADPQSFLRSRKYFSEKISLVGKFVPVDLNTSFRAAPLLLSWVDKVFEGKEESLTGEMRTVTHIAHKKEAPGKIEIWPVAHKIKEDKPQHWPPILEEEGDQLHPAERLAKKMAEEIKELVQKGINENDILVLVRQRNVFVKSLVRELKRARIAVSGLDRLDLLEEIVIQDLLSFADFLLLPEDDYHLACLLKSPIFNLTDEDLLEIAPERGKKSLWEVLSRHKKKKFRAIAETLRSFLNKVDYVTPYRLFADLLREYDGRKKFAARLGLECLEAIDEFLSLILSYEAEYPPSLQNFAHWFRSSENVIKRDLDNQNIQNVRIMTIHAAKGSEAPYVFFVEYHGKTSNTPKWHWYGLLPLWAPRKDLHVEMSLEAKNSLEEDIRDEEQRLLYVGLTRAKKVLYFCAWTGNEKPKENSWHDQCLRALSDLGLETQFIAEFGNGWAGDGVRVQSGEAAMHEIQKTKQVKNLQAMPEFFHEIPRTEIKAPLLVPSLLTEGTLLKHSESNPLAAIKGTIIHRLLEWTPEWPSTEQEAMARAYIEGNYPNFLDVEISSIVSEVMRIIHHPDFAFLFESTSMKEVPIAGQINLPHGGEAMIIGRIDRLIITEEECFILDYKSNRYIPSDDKAISISYLRQMGLYRLLMASLFPEKKTSCFLLWTNGPVLMRVPEELMAEALISLPSSPSLTLGDSPPTFS